MNREINETLRAKPSHAHTCDFLDESGRIEAAEDNRGGQLTILVLETSRIEENQVEHLKCYECSSNVMRSSAGTHRCESNEVITVVVRDAAIWIDHHAVG
jgi:hypothetical protein